MKSIKKILSIFLVVILMATSFAACGRRVDESASNSNEKVTSTPSDEPSSTPDEVTATPEASVPPVVETTAPTPEATDTQAATGTGETQADANAVLGLVEGSKYTNDYFGFSVDLPGDWYVASREELAQIMQITTDYLSSNSDTTIDLTQQNIVPLVFASSENPFTTTSTSNPNIVCLAENISQVKSMIPDVTSFLNLAMQQVGSQGVTMSFGDVETLTIDGQEVGKVSGTTVQNEMEIRQTMYVFLKGDYVIDFTLSSFTDDETAMLEDAMSTLSFK